MSKKKNRPKTPAPTQPNVPVWLIGLIAVAVIALGTFWALNTTSTPATASGPAALPSEISVSTAFEKRTQGAFILDVREPYEWEAVHIPGATLIPLGQLASRVSELPPDQEIVVVCRSGNRSQQGRDILKQAGFTQVTSMAGGMNQWQAAGFPVTSGP